MNPVRAGTASRDHELALRAARPERHVLESELGERRAHYRAAESVQVKAVDACRVLRDDLSLVRIRDADEMLFDVLATLRPRGVGMRIVGRPEQGLDADHVARADADEILLERSEDVATEVST